MLGRLRITNETDYRAWNPRHNGVKRQEEGTRVGFFGAVNLLGPRTVDQRPLDRFWNDQFTIVQLRYTFMTEEATGSYYANSSGVYGLRELDVGRIFVSVRHATHTLALDPLVMGRCPRTRINLDLTRI